MEENISIRFLVRSVVPPVRLVLLAQDELIRILDKVSLFILTKLLQSLKDDYDSIMYKA